MSQEFRDELKDHKKEEEEKLSYFEYWQLMGMEDLLEKMDELSEKTDKMINAVSVIIDGLSAIEKRAVQGLGQYDIRTLS